MRKRIYPDDLEVGQIIFLGEHVDLLKIENATDIDIKDKIVLTSILKTQKTIYANGFYLVKYIDFPEVMLARPFWLDSVVNITINIKDYVLYQYNDEYLKNVENINLYIDLRRRLNTDTKI